MTGQFDALGRLPAVVLFVDDHLLDDVQLLLLNAQVNVSVGDSWSASCLPTMRFSEVLDQPSDVFVHLFHQIVSFLLPLLLVFFLHQVLVVHDNIG